MFAAMFVETDGVGTLWQFREKPFGFCLHAPAAVDLNQVDRAKPERTSCFAEAVEIVVAKLSFRAGFQTSDGKNGNTHGSRSADGAQAWPWALSSDQIFSRL